MLLLTRVFPLMTRMLTRVMPTHVSARQVVALALWTLHPPPATSTLDDALATAAVSSQLAPQRSAPLVAVTSSHLMPHAALDAAIAGCPLRSAAQWLQLRSGMLLLACGAPNDPLPPLTGSNIRLHVQSICCYVCTP